MHADALRLVRNCPTCAIISGGGKQQRLPLHPIPVEHPFQTEGVYMMDLPKTVNETVMCWSFNAT